MINFWFFWSIAHPSQSEIIGSYVTLLSPRAVSPSESSKDPHLGTLSSQSQLHSGFALLELFAVAVLMGVR